MRSLPFQYNGLDYLGPLYIKCGYHADRIKVWVCLFTCVAVRAIHLEIVADISAEEFLLHLRRFIARRGKPQQIVLHSVPQFKLTKSLVDVAWENAVRDPNVQSDIAEQRIKCSFIVQLSPWMRGFYERLVGISNWKDMPHNVKPPNFFDRNRSNYQFKTASILGRRSK